MMLDQAKYAQNSLDLDIDAINLLSFGVPRSGSTWIWSILGELYPIKTVIKTHNYLRLPESIPIIGCYRDFRDCAVSNWRKDRSATDRMTEEEMFLYAGIYRHPIWILNQYAKRRHVGWIRYEEAIDNPGVIFDVIAQHLDRHVSASEHTRIIAAHSIETHRKQIADKTAYLMSPHHIHEGTAGNIGAWRRFVPDADLFTELLKEPLRQWNYL